MSAPLAMIRGGGLAAEKGILMRSGEAFEIFKDIKKIIFNKTGTITRGKPRVVKVIPYSNFTKKEILQWAGSAESVSEHPLAQAIIHSALGQNIELSEVEDYKAISGHGIIAKIQEKTIRIGSLPYLQEEGVDFSGKELEIKELESQGNTVVGITIENEAISLIAIADTIKDDARES